MQVAGQDFVHFWCSFVSTKLANTLNSQQMHGLLGVLGALLFFATTLDTVLTCAFWQEFSALIETAAWVSYYLKRSACDEALLLPLLQWMQLCIPVHCYEIPLSLLPWCDWTHHHSSACPPFSTATSEACLAAYWSCRQWLGKPSGTSDSESRLAGWHLGGC